jgi:hypothetical protein
VKQIGDIYTIIIKLLMCRKPKRICGAFLVEATLRWEMTLCGMGVAIIGVM